MMVIVAMAFVMGITLTENESLEERIALEPEPKIITGQYTIIHYPSGGWANAVQITEYYLKGQVLWYKEKGSTKDKPIWLSSIIIADGWLEGEQLVDYGYWLPDDIEFDNGG
jgi:hypothetical protein